MDITLENFTFNGTNWGTCTVLVAGLYELGNPAIDIDTADGEPLTRVTVNPSGILPAAGCAFVKDDAENEGILLALYQAGLLEPTGRIGRSGWGRYPEARPIGALDAAIKAHVAAILAAED